LDQLLLIEHVKVAHMQDAIAVPVKQRLHQLRPLLRVSPSPHWPGLLLGLCKQRRHRNTFLKADIYI
jgi:hypothetical protein